MDYGRTGRYDTLWASYPTIRRQHGKPPSPGRRRPSAAPWLQGAKCRTDRAHRARLQRTRRTSKTCDSAKRSQIENARMRGDVSEHQHFIKMTGLLQMASFSASAGSDRTRLRRLLDWL